MKKIILFVFMSFFVCGKSILILSTYSEGYPWTNTLLNHIYSNYSLDYEVDFLEFEKKLDTYQEKYNTFDREFKELTDKKKYDFIIVLDEDAYFYIESQSNEFHKNNFVVAAGILPNIGQSKTDYVIYEDIDMEKNIKLALKFNPKLKGIVLLNLSRSPKAYYLNAIFKSMETKYSNVSFKVFQDRNRENLKKFLTDIPEDYFFIQGYYPDSTYSGLKEVDYWNILNDNIKNPVLSYWSTEMHFSFSLGGYITTSDELGSELIEVISKHQEGTLVGKSMKVEGHYLFNGKNLDNYEYSLRKLPKSSVLINDEYLNVDLYRKLLYTLLIFIAIVSSTLIILFINFKKNKKLYKKIIKQQEKIDEKNKEFIKSYTNFSLKLAMIAEAYDETTGKHIYRVGALSKYLAKQLGLSEKLVLEIENYAPLHDIGKIFIPNEILNKTSALNEKEWNMMKSHTLKSSRLLDRDRHFKTALNIAIHHHEKYDGTGYPFGLKGKDIPVEANIVSLVDVYDALRSKRPYKPTLTHEEVIGIIKNGDGRTKPEHFYPELLNVFLEKEKEIKELWEEVNNS